MNINKILISSVLMLSFLCSFHTISATRCGKFAGRGNRQLKLDGNGPHSPLGGGRRALRRDGSGPNQDGKGPQGTTMGPRTNCPRA